MTTGAPPSPWPKFGAWRPISEIPHNTPHIQGWVGSKRESGLAQSIDYDGHHYVTWFDKAEGRVTHFMEVDKP